MGPLRYGEPWAIGLGWKVWYDAHFSVRTDIKMCRSSTVTLTLPPTSYLSFHSSTLPRYFIYRCCPAPPTPTHSRSLSHPTMVAATRLKNKKAHPAAPVMTEAAKQKAGIKTNRRSKKLTKAETIRQLEARIAEFENPHEEALSKEPLVRAKRWSLCTRYVLTLPSFSREAVRHLMRKTPCLQNPRSRPRSTPTIMFPLGKNELRAVASLTPGKFLCPPVHSHVLTYPNRALKRTKAYSVIEDVHPTLRNKPSGLRTDWHNTVGLPAPRQRVPLAHARSSSSSGSSSSSVYASSSMVPQSPEPDLDLDFDHTSSLLAISPPPHFGRLPPSPPFYGNSVPLIDAKAPTYQQHGHAIMVWILPLLAHSLRLTPPQPFSLPRSFKDDQGRKQQPGLRDLPQWLRKDFRNLYIRRILERVCLGETPWNNPGLPLLQRELNHVFPIHRIRLHSDDAVVVPVCFDRCRYADLNVLKIPRLFGTLGFFGIKSGTKDLWPLLNTCRASTTRGCWRRKMQEQSILRQFSRTPNAHSCGNISVQGRYRFLANAHITTRYDRSI
jgi:hypothetical protein